MQSLVALVTGGASGLGLAVCRRLSRNGFRVVSLDLQQNNSQSEDAENYIQIKGDIRRESDIASALSRCTDAESGRQRLDVVVNCAGVANAFKLYNFESRRPQRLEDFKELFEINVFGLFDVIRLSVPLLAANPLHPNGTRGLVVNTSSILAVEGHEGQTGFSASQAAIDAMTLPLARDLSSQGIRVNTIAAGFFATPLVLRSDSPELLDFIRMTTPCPQRLGETDEFAHLVQTLISNPMINGEVIRIDGALRWPERG